MKRLLGIITVLLGSAFLLGSCTDTVESVINRAAVKTISPLTDESGSLRVYTGDEVTITGFNLDRVSEVRLGGVKAAIGDQSVKQLVFTVPDLGFAQQDNPHLAKLVVLGADADTVYQYNYYVTVPVTDAVVSSFSPAEGTVGTEVTLIGRNLDKLTKIRFAGIDIPSSAFASQSIGEVKFAVPASAYAKGNTSVEISAEWTEGGFAVTSPTATFTVKTPNILPVVQQGASEAAKLGDEIAFTGENIDLADSFVWGTYEFIVVNRSATALTLKVPSTITETTPPITSNDIAAVWGTPAQHTVMASSFRVDTSPIGPARPTCSSVVSEDGGKLYLGNTVVVTGTNLTNVEGILVDGINATIDAGPTDTRLTFAVPSAVTFAAAQEVAVKALYNGGNELDFGTITVYPFYHYSGIRLGIGSNSKNTYADYAAEHAIYYPDLNKVYSSADWVASGLDGYAALQSSNAAVSAANTYTAAISPSQYAAVLPYIYFITNSGGKLSVVNPANSASQLKCHFYTPSGSTSYTSISTTFGTPWIMFRVMNSETENAAYGDKVRDGSLNTMAYDGDAPTSNAPAYSTEQGTGSTQWLAGSVILAQYKAMDGSIVKTGFIYVRDVTCPLAAPSGTQQVVTTDAEGKRGGYVEFDIFWSK